MPTPVRTAPPRAARTPGRAGMLALSALVACNPWREIHEAELIWHDADRIEEELDLSLTPLRAAAPIGPWPRVVVRADRIDFDNRAWFLSLPDAHFLDPDASFAELSAPLVVQPGVVTLQDGRLAPSDRQGSAVPALYALLNDQAERAKAAGVRFGGDHRFGGHVTLVAEPDVPIETVSAVLFTAGQAQFGSWMLAGRAEDRLQAALSMPPLLAGAPERGLELRALGASCRLSCAVYRGGAQERARCGALPPIAAAPGCPADDGWVFDALATLRDRCLTRWAAAPPPGGSDDPEPCIRLDVTREGQVYQQLVDDMAAVHAHHPKLRQPFAYAASSGALDGAGRGPAACDFALDPATLTDAQLDVACASAPAWRDAAAPGLAWDHPTRRWPPLSDAHTAAFPAHADWYAGQAAAAVAEWERERGGEAARPLLENQGEAPVESAPAAPPIGAAP